MPTRIQLRRTKGWRLPAGAVVVLARVVLVVVAGDAVVVVTAPGTRYPTSRRGRCAVSALSDEKKPHWWCGVPTLSTSCRMSKSSRPPRFVTASWQSARRSGNVYAPAAAGGVNGIADAAS